MLTSMIHASPTGAIRPPSVRHCPREATNASAPWDEKVDTAKKVMGSNPGGTSPVLKDYHISFLCFCMPLKCHKGDQNHKERKIGWATRILQNRGSFVSALPPTGGRFKHCCWL